MYNSLWALEPICQLQSIFTEFCFTLWEAMNSVSITTGHVFFSDDVGEGDTLVISVKLG